MKIDFIAKLGVFMVYPLLFCTWVLMFHFNSESINRDKIKLEKINELKQTLWGKIDTIKKQNDTMLDNQDTIKLFLKHGKY